MCWVCDEVAVKCQPVINPWWAWSTNPIPDPFTDVDEFIFEEFGILSENGSSKEAPKVEREVAPLDPVKRDGKKTPGVSPLAKNPDLRPLSCLFLTC